MVRGPHLTVHPRESGGSSVDPLRPTASNFDVEAQNATPKGSVDKHVHISEPASASSSREDQFEAPSHRRRERTNTFKSLRKRGRAETINVSYSAAEMGRTTGWAPGQEPGLDPNKPPPGYSVTPEIEGQLCEITCVDYSADNMSMVNLDNTNLQEHLEKPAPDWAQVRWINVNGLSWDVVRIIGSYKGLHPLAIEDLMNTRSRTKADWYNDHTFIVLPLQKLVNLEDGDNKSENDSDGGAEDSSIDDSASGRAQEGDETETHFMSERERRRHENKQKKKRRGAIYSLFTDVFRPKKRKDRSRTDTLTKTTSVISNKVTAPWLQRNIRTLQRYHAGPNQDRMAWFERNAVLSVRGLGVSVEQVSIFLTADNTVVSFFEFSAQDVEAPIIRRLQTEGTILRESGDASMLMQSILDTVIDLAIPVTTAYQDALGDLELEVLTDPDISESKTLYILTSEISVLRNAIAPVANLMSALKDHKSNTGLAMQVPSRSITPMPETANQAILRPVPAHRGSGFHPTPNSGVNITPLTVTYLGDVEDHALLIQDSYDQMRRSADNLVDLIFNTVSAYQNESMKQLTVVTCFFLPLTFLTGYFGMNFDAFPAVKDHGDDYFWAIAIPVSVVVFIILMRDVMWRFIQRVANKALINRIRKRRLERGTSAGSYYRS